MSAVAQLQSLTAIVAVRDCGRSFSKALCQHDCCHDAPRGRARLGLRSSQSQQRRAVYQALGQRAIKIIAAASTTGAKADVLLDDLVDKSASFDLIVGDVGSPGTGVTGARALANTMNADEFRFLGWDYMHRPADACEKQAVTVEFVNSRDRRISQIELTFQRARLIAAKGWQRSFESGALTSTAIGGNGG